MCMNECQTSKSMGWKPRLEEEQVWITTKQVLLHTESYTE